MANCCATGCASGGCGVSGAAGMITFEMFLDQPDKFRPFLYTKQQFDGLSNSGKKSYMDNVSAYNSMCDLAEMTERKINENEPWK